MESRAFKGGKVLSGVRVTHSADLHQPLDETLLARSCSFIYFHNSGGAAGRGAGSRWRCCTLNTIFVNSENSLHTRVRGIKEEEKLQYVFWLPTVVKL